MRPTLLSALPAALALIWLATAPAHPAIGPWVETDVARIRLIASGGEDGTASAALEIVLEPGWKTYWRNPGEGGLAPTFDFSGSRNVGDVTVSFPPPRRYDDGVTVTNVYEDRLVLPLSFEPVVAGAPVTLNLAAEIGVCLTVCIPMTLSTVLTMSPTAFDPEAASLIQVARARLPGPPREGAFTVTALRRTGVGPDRVALEATVMVPQPEETELFVEAPPGWLPLPPQAVARRGDAVIYAIMLERFGEDVAPASEVRLTVVSGGEAIEQTVAVE